LNFKDINFGYASAETERAEAPQLLTEGYVELRQALTQARTGPKFLFLGYKGAGKSAVGERLSLDARGKHDEFVRLVHLGDFPFTPFSKMIRGDVEPEMK